ncbi:MAG: guanylate kinase [Bacteroidales bacterium]|nr:guanylate kinase [Bacteroidales bacterium]
MVTAYSKMIIVSAPSGAGKSTIVKHLLKSGLNLEFSVSATSRPIREGEVDGREYHFISTEDFKKKIEAKELLEWQEVYPGSYYGTLVSEVARIHSHGHFPIFDVDVVGGLNIKKMYKRDALALFIQPPSVEVLEKRLRSRATDSEASLQKRLDKVKWELEFASKFDEIVINDQLEFALSHAERLVREFLT